MFMTAIGVAVFFVQIYRTGACMIVGDIIVWLPGGTAGLYRITIGHCINEDAFAL